MATTNLTAETFAESVGRDGITLVDWWASWCGPCKTSFPVLAELHTTYAAKGLVILAVSVDEKADEMQRFLKKLPAPFPVVRDAEQKLVAAVAVQTMPTSFILDRDGKVRAVHSGFHGDKTRKEYVAEIGKLLNAK